VHSAEPGPARATPGSLASGELRARPGDPQPAPAPAVLVDLDEPAPPEVLAAAVRAAPGTDRLLIGVATRVPAPAFAPLIAALDTTLVPLGSPADRAVVAVVDPVAEAAAVLGAVAAAPGAASVLAALLRWSADLAVPAALDAESLAYSTLLGGPEFGRWLGRWGSRPPPPPARGEPVLVERRRDVLHVTLNRPERRNAYGREVRDALVSALHLAEVDPSLTRVVLAGAGPAFCSGGDLDEFGTAPDPVTAHLVRTRAGAALPLHRLRGRVEARLHGPCVGAGIELPAFAGRVIATPDATFRLPELGMGLIPGAGGTVGIPRRIGRWRTAHLALTGRTLDAATALDWGLVDAIDPIDVVDRG
jgi:enoyl-CoA hydratase/carnithine racemase